MTAATALILGASGGLGTALTSGAVARGLRTFAYSRGVEDLPIASPLLTRRSLDLSDRAAVETVDLPDASDLLVFWVAGFFVKGRLWETEVPVIDAAVAVMFHHPLLLLRRALRTPLRRIHLVTIASSSTWKAREHEAIYCAVKAAQATVTRQLLPDLRARADSARVTLVQPGGLAVPNFHGEHADNIGHMLDVELAAEIIWNQVGSQRTDFEEMQLLRRIADDGTVTPEVTFGPRTPFPPAPRSSAAERRAAP